MVVITLHRGPMMVQSYVVYRITGNFGGVGFCGFGLKRRHIIFADLFFCGSKMVCITGSNNRNDATINNWCTLQ